MIGKEEIEHRFGHHQATIEGPSATLPKHAQMRINYSMFAVVLDKMLPDGREKSLAFTALEEASMWSHKAVAKHAPLTRDTTVADAIFGKDDNNG